MFASVDNNILFVSITVDIIVMLIRIKEEKI